ncbi:hypothetical protein SOPP22_08515 [Shewanella sp. OPT22]|nr:hypothetical protein SOPP22_08515 [Shewanella sp. OPT22]
MKTLVLIATLSLITFSSVASAEQRVAYKCFLETTLGNKVIYFHWAKSKVKKRLANLVTSSVPIQGKQRAIVKHKVECIKAAKKFSNKEAFEIDAKNVD